MKLHKNNFIGCLLWLNQRKCDNCYFCIWTQILLQCFPWFENLLVVLDGETSVYRCSVANGHARDQQLWNLQQNDFVWMSVIYNISQTIHRPSRLHRFLRKTSVQCKGCLELHKAFMHEKLFYLLVRYLKQDMCFSL